MKKMVLILLSLVSISAYANGCGGEYQPQTGTCRIIGSDGREILYNVGQPQSGNSAPPQKIIKYVDVKVPSKYGALALSKKAGFLAGAVNQNSRIEAEQAAIRQCQKGSRNTPCKAIAWVRNGCLAAAMGKLRNESLLVEGVGELGMAEQIAIKNCEELGATECHIIAPEACSLPDGM